jgi:16S rRNA (cytosine967-C5)-methyltransferase
VSAAGLAARAAAHRALSTALRRKCPLDVALDESLSAQPLADRDSGFARAIASETLRRFGQLDELVRRFVPRAPPPHRAGATLEILLAGACELLFLDVAPHAAVDGANRLAAADLKMVHFKPLINATLRRIAREGHAIVAAQDAARLNTPDWLWARWCDSYGEETARAITRVHAQTPPLDLHLRDFAPASSFPPPLAGEVRPQAGEGGSGESDCRRRLPPLAPSGHPPPPTLLRSFGGLKPEPAEASAKAGRKRGEKTLSGHASHETVLPGGIVRLEHSGHVEALPGFTEGKFWVQDFAASLPVRLFGDITGRRVIDLCAAPGGKTAQFAAAGAEVIAVERDPVRLERLAANLRRLNLDAQLVLSDARDFRPENAADFVLLDAPCSATGTIRRHPELPWIKSPGDIAACSDSAGELLDAAAEMVSSGGTLVFAVCSLEPEEGVEQIGHFLRRYHEFRRVPITQEELFGLDACISADGDLRTLPCHFSERGGMDGFYAARLVRS